MAITYRDEKGSPLSPAEVDENFRTLQSELEDTQANIPAGVGIADITQAGSTFTIHLTDSSTMGPFDIPFVTFTDTGTFAVGYEYAALDMFTYPNSGLYLVLMEGYTGADPFNPEVTDSDGNPFLKLVVATGNGPQTVVEEPASFSLSPSTHRNVYVNVESAIEVEVAVVLNTTETSFQQGDTVVFRQSGAGQIVLVPDMGVTIQSPETLRSRKQFSTLTLLYYGEDVYHLAGDVEALSSTTTGT